MPRRPDATLRGESQSNEPDELIPAHADHANSIPGPSRSARKAATGAAWALRRARLGDCLSRSRCERSPPADSVAGRSLSFEEARGGLDLDHRSPAALHRGLEFQADREIPSVAPAGSCVAKGFDQRQGRYLPRAAFGLAEGAQTQDQRAVR